MKNKILIQLAIVFSLLIAFVCVIHYTEKHAKISINGQDYYIPQASLNNILDKAQVIAQDEESKLKTQLDKEFEAAFKIVDKNIDAYLNWNYSVQGSVTQTVLLGVVTTFKVVDKVFHFDKDKMNKLEAEIQNRLFTEELMNELHKTKDKLKQVGETSSRTITNYVKQEVSAQEKPFGFGRFLYLMDSKQDEKESFDTKLSTLNTEINDSNAKKFGFSLLSGTGVGVGIALFKEQIVKHLIPQFTERLVISLAEKLVAKGMIKAGGAISSIGAATGAAMLACGPVCGFAAAVGTFALSEYVINKIDQYLNRDQLKLQFLSIFIQVKDSSINQIVSQYQQLNHVLFAKNNHETENKIKMIDILKPNKEIPQTESQTN